MKSKAEDILKQLESFKGVNECDLFVQVKMGFSFLNDEEEKFREICRTDEKPSIHFEINRSIEEYIASLKTFWIIFEYTCRCNSAASNICNFTSDVIRLIGITRKKPSHDIKHVICNAQFYGKFGITEKSDNNKCDISSICQLFDDTFLITDWDNKKIKRLDKSLRLLSSIQLSTEPRTVCTAGPGQAAVSLCLDKRIQFVSVGNKLTLTRSFTVSNICRGIVYNGNELFVCVVDVHDSSTCCIEVYNNTGQLQRTVSRAPKSLSSASLYITASDDGKHLLVTSFKSDNITMLDLTGNVVSNFSHKDLINPYGICTDGRGQVFVCGCDSNTVVQLSPKHQKIEVILRKTDGIKKPQAVCYDKGNSTLFVSCLESNEILSFTLK